MPDTDTIARSIAKSLGDDALVDKLAALKPRSSLRCCSRCIARTRTSALGPTSNSNTSATAARIRRRRTRALSTAWSARFSRLRRSSMRSTSRPRLRSVCVALTGIDQNLVLSASRSLRSPRRSDGAVGARGGSSSSRVEGAGAHRVDGARAAHEADSEGHAALLAALSPALLGQRRPRRQLRRRRLRPARRRVGEARAGARAQGRARSRDAWSSFD